MGIYKAKRAPYCTEHYRTLINKEHARAVFEAEYGEDLLSIHQIYKNGRHVLVYHREPTT